MSKSKTNSKINFLSFVVLAGDDSNDEITRKHATISEIARRSSSHFEVILLRSPRRDLSSSSSDSLRRELSNCIFIEQSSRVSRNASAIIGLRQAIGDWAVILDRSENQLEAIAALVDSIDYDHEVVFGKANAGRAARQSISYRVGQRVFGWAFTAIHGSNFSSEAPVFRAMSRSAISLVLAARRPDVEFRAFITSAALPAKTISFQATLKENKTPFWQSYGSAMEMLLGGTKVPMRFCISCVTSWRCPERLLCHLCSCYRASRRQHSGWLGQHIAPVICHVFSCLPGALPHQRVPPATDARS